MIDINELNEASAKVIKKTRKTIEGTDSVIVLKDGKELERVATASIAGYAKDIGIDANACEVLLEKPWCQCNGYSFVKVGG